MTPREAIPLEWTSYLGTGKLGIGHDIATTTKGTSNWSSLAVMEHLSPLYIIRLMLRWRTATATDNLDILDAVISDIEHSGRRPRRMAVDASNEKYHADRIKQHFAGRVPVELVVAGESIDWRGEKYNYKTLTGDLYSEAFEDNLVAMPGGIWILDDHRLVGKEGGRYITELGKDGGHGDTFDAGKLSLWALTSKASFSPGSVRAAPIGSTFGADVSSHSSNPYAPHFENHTQFLA